MFGGTSSATRNARVAELLDMGFSRAPNRVAVNIKPAPPSNSRQLVKTATLILKAPRAVVESSIPVRRPGTIVAMANMRLSQRNKN